MAGSIPPNRIHEHRRQAGLTQAGLARRLGAGRVTVNRWEQGSQQPSLAQALALAEAFDCGLDDLFGRVADDTPTPRRKPTHAGRRRHEAARKRAAAERAGESTSLWRAVYDVSNLIYRLAPLRFDGLALEEHNVELLARLLVDVAYLQETADHASRAIQARIGDHNIAAKIAALHAKTVANGAEPAEAEAAQAAARRLQRKLDARLDASIELDTEGAS